MLRLITPLALACLTPLAAGADVWTVDPSGAGDFLEIQPAVDAAAKGDLIVVQPGTYPGFVVDHEGVAVVARQDARPQVGTVRVRNIGAGSLAVFRGLELRGDIWSTGVDSTGAWVQDCAGSVRFEDCRLAPGSWMGLTALHVQSSADVVLSGCTVDGDRSPSTETGLPALEAFGSRVALYDTTVVGGEGPAGPGQGDPGGAGATIDGQSFLYASGSLIRGGDGGYSWYSGYGGDAGDGLVLADGTEAWLLDCTLSPGVPGTHYGWGEDGAPGMAVVGGPPTFLVGSARGFATDAVAFVDSDTPWSVRGEPGDEVWLLVGTGGDFVFLETWRGVLALTPALAPFGLAAGIGLLPRQPFALAGHRLGTVPASGSLDLDVGVLPLPPGVQGHPALLQPLLREPGGALVLAPPSLVSVIGCSADTGSDCNDNGVNDTCDVESGASGDENANGIPDECESGPVIYVDVDAAAGGDGKSWATAYGDLQDALADADATGLTDAIWIAEGTYHPGLPGETGKSFHPVEGVALFGGFAGGETSLDQRDLLGHATILSGDLDGDGTPAGNAEHVFYHVSTPGLLRIDGLVVQDGETGVSSEPGGGFVMYGPVVAGSEVAFVNCRFLRNRAWSAGGALSCGGKVSFTNCLFAENEVWGPTSEADGGAIRAWNCELTLVDCVFTGNRARFGGALHAKSLDGVVHPVEIVNTTFHANEAELGGGVVFDAPAGFLLRVQNGILWGNLDSDGGGSLESAQLVTEGAAAVELYYTDLEGLTTWAGPGNLDQDPLFVDPAGADGVPGTADDDLRLAAGSPCVDAGRNAYLPEDRFDLDLDGDQVEPTPLDLDLTPRFVDDPAAPDTGSGTPPLVDLGPYERL